MKHKFFRIAAILLCFSVLLVLVGCGAKPSPAQNETEQTAKKLFSDKWKEITSGEAVPDEICVNYNPGEIDISKAHLSDQVHMSEVCGHLCNSETKQKFFDVCKNLNIDKFEAGSAAYISKDASYKYYEITLIFGEEQSQTDGGYAPKLYVDCDGGVTVFVYDENRNMYILHGTGINYGDFAQFEKVDERVK